VKIPLPKLMRHWRDREFERHLNPATVRANLAVWAFFARRPALYRLASRMAAAGLGLLGRKRGRFSMMPMASGWTEGRDLPAPEGDTFFARYAKAQRAGQV
jgi:L-lactate dehydrogenase complex protein LldF